jgi:hypothetical protein
MPSAPNGVLRTTTMASCSRKTTATRCRRTGSACTLLHWSRSRDSEGSGCMTSATVAPRCCWHRERTSRSSQSCSATRASPLRPTPTVMCSQAWAGRPPSPRRAGTTRLQVVRRQRVHRLVRSKCDQHGHPRGEMRSRRPLQAPIYGAPGRTRTDTARILRANRGRLSGIARSRLPFRSGLVRSRAPCGDPSQPSTPGQKPATRGGRGARGVPRHWHEPTAQAFAFTNIWPLFI